LSSSFQSSERRILFQSSGFREEAYQRKLPKTSPAEPKFQPPFTHGFCCGSSVFTPLSRYHDMELIAGVNLHEKCIHSICKYMDWLRIYVTCGVNGFSPSPNLGILEKPELKWLTNEGNEKEGVAIPFCFHVGPFHVILQLNRRTYVRIIFENTIKALPHI